MMTPDEVMAFVSEHFPQAMEQGFTVERITDQGLVLRLECEHKHLRPGDTVSGPTIMWMADCAFWLSIIARVGPEALAVTTNININYMRKASRGTLYAEARIMKLGKRLCGGDVVLTQPGLDGPVAHATLTYSRPPQD